MRHSGPAFVVTGTVATVLSLAVFACSLHAGAAPHAATVLRLLVSLPILYAGYSRFVLADTLAVDRAEHGTARAEARMIVRVASAVGAGMILKLAIEPALTTWLGLNGGALAASVAPLVGDLGYGPLATYVVLVWARGPAVTARRT